MQRCAPTASSSNDDVDVCDSCACVRARARAAGRQYPHSVPAETDDVGACMRAHCTEGNMDEKEKEKKRKERESGTACSANSHRNQRMPKPSATGWWEGRRHDPHIPTRLNLGTHAYTTWSSRGRRHVLPHMNPTRLGRSSPLLLLYTLVVQDMTGTIASPPNRSSSPSVPPLLKKVLVSTACCVLGHPHWLQPAL